MYLPRRMSRAATAIRPARVRTAAAAALVSAAAAVALTGCSGFEYVEDICSSGEYPVLSVGGPGGSCVADKEEPPAGSMRYPEGKVPKQVDDKWDVYWDTRTLDKDGNVIKLPAVS